MCKWEIQCADSTHQTLSISNKGYWPQLTNSVSLYAVKSSFHTSQFYLSSTKRERSWLYFIIYRDPTLPQEQAPGDSGADSNNQYVYFFLPVIDYSDIFVYAWSLESVYHASFCLITNARSHCVILWFGGLDITDYWSTAALGCFYL